MKVGERLWLQLNVNKGNIMRLILQVTVDSVSNQDHDPFRPKKSAASAFYN